MRTCALVLVAAAALGAEKPVLYRLPRSGETNLVDEAHFSLAESYASRGDLRAALPILERIGEKSPDEGARSAARLGLSKLCRELGDEERAEAELAKVTGKLAAKAVHELIIGDLRDGEVAAAAGKLLSFLEGTEDPFARAAAARKLIDLVRGKRLDVEFLERLCGLLSYGEVEALAKAEGEMGSVRSKYVRKLEGEIARLREGGFWEEAKRLAQKLKVPVKPKKLPKGLVEKIGRLEAEGRFEEARKLKEKLKRFGAAGPEKGKLPGLEPAPDEEF